MLLMTEPEPAAVHRIPSNGGIASPEKEGFLAMLGFTSRFGTVKIIRTPVATLSA